MPVESRTGNRGGQAQPIWETKRGTILWPVILSGSIRMHEVGSTKTPTAASHP